MTTGVGIVVLNWHGGARTHAAVESARMQGYPHTFVVLVDNGSGEAECAALQQHYGAAPDVHLCLLPENRGYAGGNNAGIREALRRGADLVLVLTQDACLRPGALAILADAALADPRIGIVGPQVVDTQPPHRVQSAGERLPVALLCVPRTLLRYRRRRSTSYDVGGVLGCAMLFTRRCIETAGMFDESFFAYYEEVDLCLRARRHGFRIVCAPGAVVEHDGMRGFLGGFTPLSAELKARNLLRLLRRWATPLDWLVLVPTALALFASSSMLYAIRGRGDVVRALGRGARAAWHGRTHAPSGDSDRSPG